MRLFRVEIEVGASLEDVLAGLSGAGLGPGYRCKLSERTIFFADSENVTTTTVLVGRRLELEAVEAAKKIVAIVMSIGASVYSVELLESRTVDSWS